MAKKSNSTNKGNSSKSQTFNKGGKRSDTIKGSRTTVRPKKDKN